MVRQLELSERTVREGLDPVVAVEIDNFERETEAYLEGKGLGDDYRPFRLQHGVYGQRQDRNQMVRVKIPHGSLTAHQMDVLADIVEKFSERPVGHVTTRQDIQFHFVKLDKTPTIMRMLAQAGLTTREAAGNTVRNVTADHLSGLCPDTIFDVTPYAEAVARYFLRHPVAQKLPRKFKIAFSACPHDHGLIPIHDLGAMAVIRRENGVENKGFRVSVGGGLGPTPRVADVLDEFVPEEELVRTVEAVLRVFDRLGQRRNRNKARIKFLLARIGIEEFRRLVKEELAQMPPAEGGPYRVADVSLLVEAAPHLSAASARGDGRAPAPGFEAWAATNALPQKDSGYYMVYVTLPIGDLAVAQFRVLADMARRFSGGRLRVANNQNIVLRWVHAEDLSALHADLVRAGLAENGALTLSDVMTCPGADTCSQGITASKGLGHALREKIRENGTLSDPLVRQIRIKISGCPNSCGHHQIADIGFYGNSVHKNGRLVPAYHMMVGGNGAGEGVIGKSVMKIAARYVPEAVMQLIEHYKSDRHEGEPFRDYVRRVGTGHLRELLDEYREMPEFERDPMAFVDWGATKFFDLEGMGEGECVA
jgi:sulfite reductase (ferredoxin)